MSFEERYAKLNKEQKKAVDTIQGPVLVVAGPGSGKTEILSLRVANILRETDIPSGAILCLTFTDSASVNMRERLSGLIGTDAYRVQIHTFHSFGVSIINRFPEYFFNFAQFNPADTITQMETISGVLKELSYDNPLRSEHPDQGFVFLKPSLKAISYLKKAAITPDEFEKIIEHNSVILESANPLVDQIFAERISKKDIEKIRKLAKDIGSSVSGDFPVPHLRPFSAVLSESLLKAVSDSEKEDKTSPISEWKSKWTKKDDNGDRILKDTDRLPRMKALADVYREYQKKLYENGYYDFDDMLLQTIQVIDKNPSLCLNLQEEFQYILVDEFQDTNDAQMRLLRLLTSADVHEGRPNIMAVGDDDQAIYKFQGAEIANILQFKNLYKNPEVITLSKNYRSTQEILDLADSVISQSKNSLQNLLPEVEKKLKAENKDLPKKEIIYKKFHTDLNEYQFVAKEIKKLIGSGIKPSQIALISRTHDILQRTVPYLYEEEIPIEYEKQQNVLDLQYIRELVTVARFIDSIARKNHDEADYLLPIILSFEWWGLPRKIIWDISMKAKSNSWLSVMENYSDARVQQIAIFLISLGEIANSEPLERVVDLIIGSATLNISDSEDDDSVYDTDDAISISGFVSPFRQFYFGDKLSKHKGQYVAFLSGLKIFVQTLREYKQGKVLQISDLIELVSVYEKNNMELLDNSPFMSDTDSVQLLTSHKAKGLEFEVVFVLSATDEIWNSTNHGDILPFPNNMPIKPGEENRDDALRLFFVALTRAKHTLYITYHEKNSKGKSTLPIEFLSGKVAEDEDLDLDADHPLESAWRTLSCPPYEADEKAMLQNIIKDYRMSVTHLNNFLDVSKGGPKIFLEQNLLRFPQAKTASNVYGTAMHAVMQYIYTYLKNENHIPDVEVALEILQKKIISERLNPTETRLQIERGEKAIKLYYKLCSDRFQPEHKIEFDFKHQGVVLGEARVTGKIDKMNIKGKDITVYDFKTGKPKLSWQDSETYSAIQLHRYKYQLIFYKLLVENSRELSGYEVSEGIIEFLEPYKNSFVNLPLLIDKDEASRVQKLSEVVYSKIINLDFPDTKKYNRSLSGLIEFEDDLLKNK